MVKAIQLEISKYVKREKRKTLPPEVDFWYFNCKMGSGIGSASPVHLPDLPKAIEDVALAGGAEVYVEIMASAGNRVKKPHPATYHRREQ